MKRSSHSGFMLVVLLTALIAVPARGQAAPGPDSHAGAGHADASPPQAAKPEAAAAAAPATADEFGDDAPTIEIPADRQKLIGVQTVVAAVIPLQRTIRTIGRIEYDERALTTINTKIEGWIEKLHVNYTGDYVKKGAPVAEIYSPELYATQQEFLNVLAWTGKKPSAGATSKPYYAKESDFPDLLARDAQTLVKASRQRLKLWDISDAQIDKIARTGIPIRTLTVYSPASGFVVQKAALQGVRVMPGEKLVDIVDLSTLWVIADIYEKDLPLVKVGQKATLKFCNVPGKKIASTIDYIYPLLSGETRTVKARFTIKNISDELKPQMFTDVEIGIDLGKRLALPEAAVINTGKRWIVYLDHGDGLFEPRDVRTGVRAEGMIEITDGLAPGEKVASQANFLIDYEARLKGVVQ